MLRVRVPAKINLHLEILGRRDDGYHEVRTLLQSIDLYDDLEAAPSDDGRIHLEVRPEGAAPAGEDNLAVAAALGLAAALGRDPGVRLRLTKRIPAGAGLGGGSADAAATLALLSAMWCPRPDFDTLLPVAASLGADVPFFLLGGFALGVGRGDEVVALGDLPELGVVVAFPEVSVPTVDVYRRVEAPRPWRRPGGAVYSISTGGVREPTWDALRNDLEPIVTRGWPQVAAALAALDRDGALRVGVTGSGSAVFGLYRSVTRAAEVAERVAPGLSVHCGRTVGRHGGLGARIEREESG